MTLTVAASGSGLSYQWYKANNVSNGALSSSTAISGATSSSYTITGAHASNAGGYYVVVSNSAGSDTSEEATVVTQPVIPSGTFVITNYGAVGDGSTVNTTAIQNAVNAAVAAGGGTVEVPAASGAFMTDHFTLGSNIRLQVDSGATLQMLPPTTYKDATVNFITSGDFSTGTTAHDVEIVGPGTIDGNGSTWWSKGTRPKMLHIDLTTTAYIHNIHLTNSAKMHVMTLGSNNVTCDTVTISAPSSSPNTDGIDPAGNDILIQNCNISDGDDMIAVKAENVACNDIHVNNCTFGTGHGASVGGQTSKGVNGFRVTNCSFTNPAYVVRMKAQRGEGGLTQNVLYENLTFSGISKGAIYISSYYDSIPSDPTSDSGSTFVATSTPQWLNITIRNFKGTITASKIGDIYGVPESPIDTVLLDNAVITGTTRTIVIDHARNIQYADGSFVPVDTSSASLYDTGPVITVQPQSQTVTAGSNVTFSVTSLSSTSQSYQWYKNGSAISGATSSSYTISNAQSGNAGDYSVKITNSVKSGTASTTSDDAILAVN